MADSGAEYPYADPAFSNSYMRALTASFQRQVVLDLELSESDSDLDRIAALVAMSASINEVKWAVDAQGIDELMHEDDDPGFLVLCGLPSEHGRLRHLPILAEKRGIPWAYISSAYAQVFGSLLSRHQRVLACTITRNACLYFEPFKRYRYFEPFNPTLWRRDLRLKKQISALMWHPVINTMPDSTTMVKWGVDKSGVDEITRALSMGESAFVVLFDDPYYHKLLRHLPALAEYKRVPWVSVSPSYGKLFCKLHAFRGERVLACTITRPGPSEEEEEEVEEKTGKLNPKPYPLSDHRVLPIPGLVLDAFNDKALVYESVHEVTKALATTDVELLVVAADADPYSILLHLPPLADFKGVPFVFIPEEDELGAHIRKQLPNGLISTCCILKKQGEIPLNYSLLLFLSGFHVFKHLPHWKGELRWSFDKTKEWEKAKVEEMKQKREMDREKDIDIGLFFEVAEVEEVPVEEALGSLFAEPED